MIKKALRSYCDLSVVTKASIWFMFCKIIQKSLATLTTPIFTRIMDSDQYGYYSTYISISTILTVILTFDFDTCAYMNGIVNFESTKEKNQLATSLLSLTIIVTMSVGVIALFAKGFISDLLKLPSALIILMLLEILFIPPVKFWMVQQRFLYKYISVVLVTVGMLLINNLLGIALVLHSTSDQAVLRVLSIAIAQCVAGLIIYIFYFLKSGKFNITKYWKYGLKLNLPLVPHGLSIVILSSSDKVMINSIVGATEAGIYGIAYSVGLIINQIKLSLVDAIRPWMIDKIKKKELHGISKVCDLLFLMNILLTLIIMGVAPEIIRFFAPPSFYSAIYVVPPVAASSYFTFIYNICSIVELYYERNKRVMIASVVSAGANIILNILFIPRFGFIAAGYTTLLSFMILCVLHYIFYNSIRKEELQGVALINTKSLLYMSALVLGGMGIFTFLYSHIWLRLSLVALIVIVCFLYRNKFIALLKSIKYK